MKGTKKSRRSDGTRKDRDPARSAPAPAPTVAPKPKLDLSKIRHDLRTPINHILGYCEMLQEEEQVPQSFQADLEKIHAGGRQLLALITEYFDEETFEIKKRDLHQLYHELRTPVNHIIGYSELLQEQAGEMGRKKFIPDLEKIHTAAKTWLSLMEEYLIPPSEAAQIAPYLPEVPLSAAPIFYPGFSFQTPAPRSAETTQPAQGSLLVVDDDESNRDILARRLRHHGYTVNLAENGLQALKLVREQKFDLVLLDLIMPGIDGYQVLAKMKADPALRHIPVIMISALDQENGIARCIEMGAEDYLGKPFNSVFLRARIGACLEKKRLRDQEQRTYQALVQSQQKLAAELAEAAGYVRSLLPKPLTGPITTQWCFHPSAQLGGDAFGYHWIDEDHFAMYLLDVCGHGVGAAILSVSVLNVLRSQALPDANFCDPGAVLGALNSAFKMEKQNNMYFTIWYGVYDRRKRAINYASGGHPPAVLLSGESAESAKAIPLRTPGCVMGWMEESIYGSGSCLLGSYNRLHILSDGVYEVSKQDGKMMTFSEFVEHLSQPVGASESTPENSLRFVQGLHGSETLDDDFSLLQIMFE